MRRRLWLLLGLGLLLGACAGSTPHGLKTLRPSHTLTFRWVKSPQPEVTGYRLYVGHEPGVYDFSVDLGNVTTTSYTLYKRGLWVFALTALSETRESTFSTEASYTL